jgi:uncharacterized tellurite resistance protein B-like protein
MIQTLKDLFTHFALPIAPDEDPAQAMQLAAAELLVEVARADATTTAAEQQALLAALQRTFVLAPAALDRLVELATTAAHTAYDYQRFTGTLNDHFTQAQKIDLVEAMWQVAYADDHLDAHEHHTISKVAGLLHVTHGEYIAAKMRAKEAAQAH